MEHRTTYNRTDKGLQIGDKVCYIPFEGAGIGAWENGRVKAFSKNIVGRVNYVFVVYHCGQDWDGYKHYTSARTRVEDLRVGWKEDYDDSLKFESI